MPPGFRGKLTDHFEASSNNFSRTVEKKDWTQSYNFGLDNDYNASVVVVG
jgi:hypothetical protein